MLKQVYEINDEILELLLLADPSIEMINRYISESSIYILEQSKPIGVVVLKEVSESTIEIMNIIFIKFFFCYSFLVIKSCHIIGKIQSLL